MKLIDRYKPTALNEVIGNNNTINQIYDRLPKFAILPL